MPDFDTGSLFLTFLAPIRLGMTTDRAGEAISFEGRLRAVLALLPTAAQSPATQEIGVASPFSRNRRTHLARFVIIDDVPYNGRVPRDPILGSLRGANPITPEPVDRLTTPYLFFGADIDAVAEDGATLPKYLDEAGRRRMRDAWARELWDTMAPELRSVFENCHGFEAVEDAEGFARYLARCQVETTMPFHDYWIDPPDIPAVNIGALLALVAVPAVVALLGLAGQLLGLATTPILGLVAAVPPLAALLGGLALAAVAAVGAYAYVMARGARPFPPQPGAGLPAVLKALYLQQHFSDFVVAHQGAAPDALHRAFGDFLGAHRPDDLDGPTQAPGVISSRAPGGTIASRAPTDAADRQEAAT
ncbi:MAG: hypothetical protein ACFBWO_01445 [Paracoccaceae bacterium]